MAGRSGRATRRNATQKDVAEALGVSVMTVSNAFNRPDQLSDTLRNRILKTAHEMSYFGPSARARALRTGQSNVIAIYNPDPIVHLFQDPAASAAMVGFAAACQEHRVAMAVLPGGGAPEERPAADTIAIDGFAVYGVDDEDPWIDQLIARRRPLVMVDCGERAGAGRIWIDDRGAARQAARCLVEAGHRRIAVLSMELRPDGYQGRVSTDRIAAATYAVSRQRWRGYADVLSEAGIAPGSVPVYEIAGNSITVATRAASAMLTRFEAVMGPESRLRPTAFLCMSDHLALGARRAVEEAGLAVGRDVSIIGFDDVPAAADAGIATIRQPHYDKGWLAGTMLANWDQTAPDGRLVALSTTLVRRPSVGPPVT